jgi:hypothetical protein
VSFRRIRGEPYDGAIVVHIRLGLSVVKIDAIEEEKRGSDDGDEGGEGHESTGHAASGSNGCA